MILTKDNLLTLGVIILIGIFILQLFKSVRIEQLKQVENSKIESIGKYEKDSKIEYKIPEIELIKDSSLRSE